METKPKTRFRGCNIPEEILLQILSELPTRSLLRFRCVSKSWRFLISDLIVRRQHVIVLSHFYRPQFSFHCINYDGSVMEIPRPEPLQFAQRVRIGGSCNGFLLLNSGEDLFMWNPFTGCCKKVLSHEGLRCNRDGLTMVSGLCYDSSTDDYKVVTWFRNIGEACMVCIVGSCRTKAWTEICFPDYKKIVSCALVNEHLHWLVTDGMDQFSPANAIVYFLPQTNNFVKVLMPECNGTSEYIDIVGMGVLNGCLSVSRCTTNSNECYQVEVLVMKQYGKKESWTRLFIIPVIDGFDSRVKLVPLCCIKDMILLYQWGTQFDTILAWDLNKKSKGVFPSPKDSQFIEAAMIVEV